MVFVLRITHHSSIGVRLNRITKQHPHTLLHGLVVGTLNSIEVPNRWIGLGTGSYSCESRSLLFQVSEWEWLGYKCYNKRVLSEDSSIGVQVTTLGRATYLWQSAPFP